MFKYPTASLMTPHISHCLRILIRYSNDCPLKILYICTSKLMTTLWSILDVGTQNIKFMKQLNV